MYTVRRFSLTLLVWLTAAMTLVAGVPRFTCQCPDGRVKPDRFGSSDQKTDCRCGGNCCGKSSGKQAVTTTCCRQRTTDKAVKPRNTESVFSGGCCIKPTGQPSPATLSASSGTHIAKGAASVLLPNSDWLSSQHLFAAQCRQPQDHKRPPPTDLVIALQHYLI